MMVGKIIKQISNDYTVKADKIYVCKARGKFRNMNITPLVGDEVIINDENYILEILPRKNELKRPQISNIDEAIIITSLKKPDFSSNLLDKLLTVIEFNNIKPVIIFTKQDLLNKEEYQNVKPYIDYYKKIGYEVYMNDETSKIKKIFKGKVSVFTGQSGAGKSTLLNRLDESLNLKTDEISEALNRGKHTTRHTELINIEGGLVADTPGFSAIDFHDMSKEDIRDSFIEFNKYRDDCEYRDCTHTHEKKCKIKEKVEDGTILKSRYENYLKFIGR
ncbi:MAG: ribosome small subunit-dependent GTPase A [Bacilli bacterium]|nr:ribosome small subunit-dependent GTPase A [Bacilli bacterium]